MVCVDGLRRDSRRGLHAGSLRVRMLVHASGLFRVLCSCVLACRYFRSLHFQAVCVRRRGHRAHGVSVHRANSRCALRAGQICDRMMLHVCAHALNVLCNPCLLLRIQSLYLCVSLVAEFAPFPFGLILKMSMCGAFTLHLGQESLRV